MREDPARIMIHRLCCLSAASPTLPRETGVTHFTRRFVDRVSVLLAAALALTAGSGASLRAAETPSAAPRVVQGDTLKACFVPTTGVVYLIGRTGLPAACAAATHVEFSWSTQGEAGPPGPVGPEGPPGDGASGTPMNTPNALVQRDADGGFEAAAVSLAELRVRSDGGVVFGGAGVGAAPPSGASTRFVWAPGQAAIRAGQVDESNPTAWDPANIGVGSAAFGLNTMASGNSSFAAGSGSTASDIGAIAMGQRARASHVSAVAIGQDAEASGLLSVAIGGFAYASGAASVAINYAAVDGYTGAVVIGDRSVGQLARARRDNQFVVRASGGFEFITDGPNTTGVQLTPGGGAWITLSDRNRKQDFRSLDGEHVLARIRTMPIQEWSYIGEASRARHVGPTAQDFYAAFGLGEDGLGISTVDIDGINLFATQQLIVRYEQLKTEHDALRSEVIELRAMVERLLGAR